MKNHTSNTSTEKTEKLTSADALQLIFTTANASTLEHERINPTHVTELTKTLGRWKQPHIVTTPRGVVIRGVDYLAALAGAGKVEVDVVIDRTGSTSRRESKKPSTLVEGLKRSGIENAAFKLAVWRGIREGAKANPEDETLAQLKEKLSDPKFLEAFEGLHAPYELIAAAAAGSKATRVRSKIAFSAFHLAYHANPKKVVQLYTDFLSGKAKEGSPLEKLLHAVRHDNINTGSGRRPFMLKASILLAAELAGEKVERALADEVRGREVVSIFLGQQGNA